MQEWCDRNVRMFLREGFYLREAKKNMAGYTDSVQVALQLASTYAVPDCSIDTG